MKQTFFLTLFTLLFVVFCHARNITGSAILYDDSKGLSNSSVRALTKDKTGLLWMGTENGLNTFDGYTFTEIPFFKGFRIHILTYNELQNELWLATDKGLFWINLTDMQIIDCTVKIKDKKVCELILLNSNVYVFFENGNIIEINSRKQCRLVFGLYMLGLTGKKIRETVATDNKNFVFIMPNELDRLVAINIKNGEILVVPQITSDYAWNFGSGNGFVLVSGDDGGYAKVKYEGTTFNRFSVNYFNVRNKIGLIPNNTMSVFAMNRGLYTVSSFNAKNDTWKHELVQGSRMLKSKSIHCVYKDEQNVIWIGTNKGLIKSYENTVYPFQLFFHDLSAPVSTRQIVEANHNELYIGTYLGIFKYNKQTSAAALLRNDSADSTFPLYTRALYYDSAMNYLYAATESNTHYFFRYNITAGKFETNFFKLLPASEKINSVYALYADALGIIWLATDRGLASYNNKTKTITLHVKDIYSVGDNRLFALSKSNKPNQFWVAGKGGLFLIDIHNGVLKEWNAKTDPSLAADDYWFVSEDAQNRVWLGSKKSGLKYLSANYKTVTTFGKSEGLSNHEVYSILWQNDSIGWVTTANGLCRYNDANQTFYNLFAENGIGDNEFNQNAFLRSREGTYYLGGINGITTFNPDNINITTAPVKIFGAAISKWNRAIQTVSLISGTDLITMGPNDHLLTFSFGLSDYTETEGNTYFYKINGLYNDWVSLGTQNILRLEGLPAGKYTILIKGYTKQGIQSQNTLIYRVTIEQVYYKTWLFFVCLALAAVLLVYLYFKWRLQNIHQKQKLRTQIASNLHDEVGSLLTSITISTDNARFVAQTLDEKNLRLEKISSLSRNATNTMSDVLWSIDARNDYAGNLTDRMREHAEAMLQSMQIDVQFDFTETQQNQNINPNTRQQLYLIFKEAIHNVVKHSQATIVNVYYMQQGSSFELSVKNNNAQKMVEHKIMGQGLKNMEMRASNIKAVCLVSVVDEYYEVSIKSI